MGYRFYWQRRYSNIVSEMLSSELEVEVSKKHAVVGGFERRIHRHFHEAVPPTTSFRLSRTVSIIFIASGSPGNGNWPPV